MKTIKLDDLADSLPEHILNRIFIDEATGCWAFNGDPSSNGYMRCWYQGIRFMAHRLIFEIATGRDIRKWELDHFCENRPCCNPNHMDPVTPKVNCIRRTRRRKKPKYDKTPNPVA
jgi:hypothetical protein